MLILSCNHLHTRACVHVCAHSVVSDTVSPWTVALQAPLSMEFSRQEYWSGLLFPSPRDLPDTGVELESTTSQVDSLPSEPPGKPIVFPKWQILF